MKKWQIVLAVIALVILGAGFAFKIQIGRMNAAIKAIAVGPVDFSGMDDGVYEGEYKFFVVGVAVDVTVKSHTIVAIKIVSQSCGKGYEALDTIDRILRAQSPAVDATTGATSSSRAIMIAVQSALTGK